MDDFRGSIPVGAKPLARKAERLTGSLPPLLRHLLGDLR